MLDAERLQQGFLRSDDVGDRDRREIGAVGLAGRRVRRWRRWSNRRTIRAYCSATTNSRSVSIGLPGPISPSQLPGWPPFAGIAPGRVVAAGEAVRDEHRVAAVRREPAVGLVGDRRLRQHRAVGQRKIADREKPVLDDADIAGPVSPVRGGVASFIAISLRPRLPGLCLQLLPLSSLAGICSGFGGEPTICKPRLSCFAGWLNLQQICSEISRVSCTGASDPGESGAVPRHRKRVELGKTAGPMVFAMALSSVSSDRSLFPRRKNGAVRK